jgi:hypothetical protein
MQTLIIGIIAGLIGIIIIYTIYKFFNNKINKSYELPSLSDVGILPVGENLRMSNISGGKKKLKRKIKK